MTNVVAGIFFGLLYQMRALLEKCSALGQNLAQTLAAPKNRLRREALFRETASRKTLK